MIFHGPRDPVYTISVAARLLGVSPAFLRQVEGEGLVCPARTDSNIRLYSDEDLKLLSRIVVLCRSRGVNLQGVRVILAMEDGGNQHPIAQTSRAPIALGPGREASSESAGSRTKRKPVEPAAGRDRDGDLVKKD